MVSVMRVMRMLWMLMMGVVCVVPRMVVRATVRMMVYRHS